MPISKECVQLPVVNPQDSNIFRKSRQRINKKEKEFLWVDDYVVDKQPAEEEQWRLSCSISQQVAAGAGVCAGASAHQGDGFDDLC